MRNTICLLLLVIMASHASGQGGLDGMGEDIRNIEFIAASTDAGIRRSQMVSRFVHPIRYNPAGRLRRRIEMIKYLLSLASSFQRCSATLESLAGCEIECQKVGKNESVVMWSRVISWVQGHNPSAIHIRDLYHPGIRVFL